MGKHQRIDQPDTLDTALHLIQRLQAEGWGLAHLEHTIDYHKVGAVKLPVTATVTVRLTPRG